MKSFRLPPSGFRFPLSSFKFQVSAFLLLCLSPLHAANQTWTGTTSNNWTTVTNWSGGDYPGNATTTTNADIALFNTNPTNKAPVFDVATINLAGFTFDAGAGAFTLGTTGGNAVLLSSGSTTQVTSGDTAAQIINAFTKGAGSVFLFDFGPSLETGKFTLVTFDSSSGFTSSSFTNSPLGTDRLGSFNLTGSSLEFTVTAVPEPATWAAMAALALGGGLLVICRRASFASIKY